MHKLYAPLYAYTTLSLFVNINAIVFVSQNKPSPTVLITVIFHCIIQ